MPVNGILVHRLEFVGLERAIGKHVRESGESEVYLINLDCFYAEETMCGQAVSHGALATAEAFMAAAPRLPDECSFELLGRLHVRLRYFGLLRALARRP